MQSLTQTLHHIKHEHFVSKKIQLHDARFKKMNFYVIALGIVFGLLYIWQVNALATVGYEMRDLEVTASELKESNQQLSIQVTEAQSTARIMERLEEMDMVPVGNISYIKKTGSDVALK